MMYWRNNICVGELLLLWKSAATSYKNPIFALFFLCEFAVALKYTGHELNGASLAQFLMYEFIFWRENNLMYEFMFVSKTSTWIMNCWVWVWSCDCCMGLWLWRVVYISALRLETTLRWLWRLFEDWRLVEDWYAFWAVWTIAVTEVEELPALVESVAWVELRGAECVDWSYVERDIHAITNCMKLVHALIQLVTDI